MREVFTTASPRGRILNGMVTMEARREKRARAPQKARKTALGALIKARRDAIGMTQQELADHLGVERETIMHIETGRTVKAGPDLVNRMPDFIPVKVRELVEAIGYEIDKDASDIDRILEEDAEFVRIVTEFIARRARHRPPINGDAGATGA